MDFYINLRVNFRGNSKNFLLSGSETKSWESMEAMVRERGLFAKRQRSQQQQHHAPIKLSLPVVAVDIGVSHCGVVLTLRHTECEPCIYREGSKNTAS